MFVYFSIAHKIGCWNLPSTSYEGALEADEWAKTIGTFFETPCINDTSVIHQWYINDTSVTYHWYISDVFLCSKYNPVLWNHSCPICLQNIKIFFRGNITHRYNIMMMANGKEKYGISRIFRTLLFAKK